MQPADVDFHPTSRSYDGGDLSALLPGAQKRPSSARSPESFARRCIISENAGFAQFFERIFRILQTNFLNSAARHQRLPA
jgi:hypothetical protein